MPEPRLESDRRDPLTYKNGKVLWSDAFISCKAMDAVKPMLKGSKTRPADLGTYLYFVYSWNSMYRNWHREDRILEVLKERALDKDWLNQAISQPAVVVLAGYYQRLVLTPGQRMYFGIIEQIERFRQEIADIDATTAPDEALRKIKAGQELLKSEKAILQMISDEGERVVRGGYEPGPLELPPDER